MEGGDGPLSVLRRTPAAVMIGLAAIAIAGARPGDARSMGAGRPETPSPLRHSLSASTRHRYTG